MEMSKDMDSDEEVFFGPITARELEITWLKRKENKSLDRAHNDEELHENRCEMIPPTTTTLRTVAEKSNDRRNVSTLAGTTMTSYGKEDYESPSGSDVFEDCASDRSWSSNVELDEEYSECTSDLETKITAHIPHNAQHNALLDEEKGKTLNFDVKTNIHLVTELQNNRSGRSDCLGAHESSHTSEFISISECTSYPLTSSILCDSTNSYLSQSTGLCSTPFPGIACTLNESAGISGTHAESSDYPTCTLPTIIHMDPSINDEVSNGEGYSESTTKTEMYSSKPQLDSSLDSVHDSFGSIHSVDTLDCSSDSTSDTSMSTTIPPTTTSPPLLFVITGESDPSPQVDSVRTVASEVTEWNFTESLPIMDAEKKHPPSIAESSPQHHENVDSELTEERASQDTVLEGLHFGFMPCLQFAENVKKESDVENDKSCDVNNSPTRHHSKASSHRSIVKPTKNRVFKSLSTPLTNNVNPPQHLGKENISEPRTIDKTFKLKPPTLVYEQGKQDNGWKKKLNMSKIPRPKRPAYVLSPVQKNTH